MWLGSGMRFLLSESCEFPAGCFEYDHVVSRCMVCTAAVFGLIDKNIDNSKGKAGVDYGYW